jgi:hypothetical protein
MTLVEFLHPLKGNPILDNCLAALYFLKRYRQMESVTVEELRSHLKKGRVPRSAKANLADQLAKGAPYVDTAGKKGSRFLWTITETGERKVRSLLGLPEADAEIEHDVSELDKVVNKITNVEIADYIHEAVKCLSVGALRAAVVFLWAGAVREIQRLVISKNTKKVNISILRFDSKARNVKKIDDLSYIKESKLLLVAQDLGIFDKNQKDMLEDSLKLRNKCGHPGKYKPGPKKVSSFIEDVIGIVF